MSVVFTRPRKRKCAICEEVYQPTTGSQCYCVRCMYVIYPCPVCGKNEKILRSTYDRRLKLIPGEYMPCMDRACGREMKKRLGIKEWGDMVPVESTSPWREDR